MFKAIIIGCGKIAGYFDDPGASLINSHAAAYSSLPKVTLMDVVDIKRPKAKKLAQLYHLKSFSTDFIASINKHKPDIVSICTPDDTHFAITKKILGNRIVPYVIFIEKPACVTMDEFFFLSRASAKRGVVLIVNHSRRFHDTYRVLRKLIQKKTFGNPVRLDIFYYGGFQHNGVHVIDTLLYLFNDQLQLKELGEVIPTQYKGDPSLGMVFRFAKSKAQVKLHPFDEKYYQLFDFDFKFEKARLRVENFESKFILEKKIRNAARENVLVDALFKNHSLRSTPLANAVKLILKYLQTKDHALIRDYTLQKAQDTVQIMAKVRGKRGY